MNKGEISEQAVGLKALQLGFCVSVPLGHEQPYDMVFDNHTQLLKIQVKTAGYYKKENSYNCNTVRSRTGGFKNPYADTDFDFAIAYLSEVNIFYVVPILEFNRSAGRLRFYPSPKRKSAMQPFKEAWHLIK